MKKKKKNKIKIKKGWKQDDWMDVLVNESEWEDLSFDEKTE